MIRATLAASLPLLLTLTRGPALAAPPAVDLDAAPPMSVSAADLLALANAHEAPADEDLEYLLHAIDYTCDEAGRCTRVEHRVIRVLTERGAKWMRTFDERWKPGYDLRPELRARVVRPDGRTAELDLRTVSEQPVAASDDVYTDYRKLVAPLPAVEPGAVIETWTKRAEERPAFASGRTVIFSQTVSNPTRRLVKVMSVPSATKLRTVQVGPPPSKAMTPRVATRDGRTTVRIDGAPTQGPIPLYDPPATSSWSWLTISTVASWRDAAAEYAGIIDEVLGAPGVPEALRKLADEVIGDTTGADAIIAKVHAWIAAKLRYTSIALGEGAWVPTPPPEVVRRAYGDCKDLATLVVGLLRARGVAAHVALTRVDRYREPLSDAPGLDWFDHAIVFVSVPGEPARWLDATAAAELAPGTLWDVIAGRWALVARADEAGLSRLPAASPHGWEEIRELTLHVDGPADLVETTLATGSSGGSMRGWYKGNRISEQPGFWRTYAKSVYGEVADARQSGLDGYTPAADPFSMSVAIEGVADLALSGGDGELSLGLGAVLDRLPDALRSKLAGETADEREWRARWRERALPLDLGFIERTSVTWRVRLPRGVAPSGEVPLPEGFEVGPVSFTATTRQEPGLVEVRYQLDVKPGLLTPAQVATLNDRLVALGDSKIPQLTVHAEVVALTDRNDIAGAARLAQQIVAASPDEVVSWRWFCVALFEAGLVDAAKEAAREMVKRWPGEVPPHLLLGFTLLRDGAGRPYRRGFDPVAAQAALRAGIALDPDNVSAHRWLAEALLMDPKGGGEARPEAGAIEAGLSELAWLREHEEDALAQYELQLLLEKKEPRRAAELAAKLPASIYRDRVLVVATALADGVPAALAKHDELGGSQGERTGRVAWAAVDVFRAGKPAAARELLGVISDKSDQLTLIREVYRRAEEGREAPASGPCAPAVAWFADHGGRPEVAGLVPERYADVAMERPAVGLFSLTRVRGFLLEDGPEEDVLLRRAIACQPGATADRLVTPVTLTVDVEGPWANVRSFAFVKAAAKRGAEPEVMPATPVFIGSEALRALQKGKLNAARALLAWGVEAGSSSPIARVLVALGHAWNGSTIDALDAEQAGLVAAVWAPAGTEAKDARRRIEAALGREDATDELKGALSEAYIRALVATDDYEQAVTRIEAVASGGVNVDELCGAVIAQMQRRRAPGQAPLLARLEKLGGERVGTMTNLARMLLPDDDQAVEAAHLAAMVDAYTPDTFIGRNARNNLGWAALFDGRDLREALALVDAIPERDAAEEHTRAALLAGLDRPADAMASLRTSIEKRPEGVDQIDDVVFGRIAQGYGLHETARWYYDRAIKAPGDRPRSTNALARLWRATLPAPATP